MASKKAHDINGFSIPFDGQSLVELLEKANMLNETIHTIPAAFLMSGSKPPNDSSLPSMLSLGLFNLTRSC